MAADPSAARLRWLILPIAAPLLLFWQGVAGRRVLAPGDGFQFYLPLHVLAARIWRRGELPSWNPFEFSGAPLLATNQAAVFYPPNALFLALSPVTANNVVVLLNFLVAGVGAALLARRFTDDGPAMAVSGLVFALSGFMVAHLGHQSMIASISWLPWALLAFDRLLERVTPLRLLFGGGTLALSLLAGHGQMFFQIIFAVGLYAAAMSGANGTRIVRSLLVAALMVVVGAALAGIQLLPTASILEATDRSKVSFETATEFSLSGSHAVLAFFPYLFGNSVPSGPYTDAYRGLWNLTELSGYAGLAAVVLAAVGFASHRRDRRVIAIAAVGAVAFAIALGRSTPLAWIVYRVPIYGQFRDWARYLATFDLAVAVLAGYGIAAVRQATAEARRRHVLVASATVAALGALGVVAPRLSVVERYAAEDRTAAYAVGVPLACAAFALLCIVVLRRIPRLATAGLVSIVAVDAIVSFGAFYEWRTRAPHRKVVEDDMASPPRSGEPFGPPVTDAPGGIDRYFFTGLDIGIIPSVGRIDVRGDRSVNGFDPLAPADYMAAAGDMVYYGGIRNPTSVLRRDSRLLDVLRVSVVLFDPREDPNMKRPPPAGLRVVEEPPKPLEGTPALRYEYQPALADAYLVGGSRRVPHADAVAAARGYEPWEPDRQTLYEVRCRPCRAIRAPGPAGTVRDVRWGMSTFDAVATADRPALLTISQAWFPGWHARVSGKSAPVLRANGLVQAVPVPKGTHRVHLFYRPPRQRLGVLLTAVTVAALLGWAAIGRVRRRE